jgi:hypothetical protein
LDVLPDFARPTPMDWAIHSDACSVFSHLPTGTEIAFPVRGPWQCNPAATDILANDTIMLALCSG